MGSGGHRIRGSLRNNLRPTTRLAATILQDRARFPETQIRMPNSKPLTTFTPLHPTNRNCRIQKLGKTTLVQGKQEFLFQKLTFPISHAETLPAMICPICNQESELSGNEYCTTHQRALENIRQAFEKWAAAYENLTPPDFLKRLEKAPGIGPKAKEIARFLSQNPSRWKQ